MNEELAVVTEVGVFGDLGLDEVTKKPLSQEEMESVIEATKKQNRENLQNLNYNRQQKGDYLVEIYKI